MKGLRSIVPLSRDSLRGIEAATIVGEEPTVEWVNPLSLFVEEDYQRDVGENGTALIRRIVAEFSWHKFKAPICFKAPEFDGALVVVDGQHTSIGCATRGIERIPVMVYANASAAQRAAAFVAHNRDRVALTMQAVFKADLAAGDLIALQANRACEAAGAKILTHAINLAQERPVGETMAVGTLRAIIRRVGPEHLTRVMKVLVAAKRGPIKAQEISAASMILLGWKGSRDVDERLDEVVASKTAKRWASLAASESGTLPQALTTLWLRELNSRIPAATKTEPGPAPKEIVAPPPRPAPSLPPRTPSPVKRTGENDKQPAEFVKPAAPPPEPKPRAPIALTTTNGITVTLDGAVIRNGWKTVNVGANGAKLVARLVSVMPANIPIERVATHVFDGRGNARLLLEDLVAAVNPELKKAGLEIYCYAKTALMIRAMAKSGENLLRA